MFFLKALHSSYSLYDAADLVHHAAGMAQYKPGHAIGSIEGRASARNQRDMLRILPEVMLEFKLLKTQRVGHFAAY